MQIGYLWGYTDTQTQCNCIIYRSKYKCANTQAQQTKYGPFIPSMWQKNFPGAFLLNVTFQAHTSIRGTIVKEMNSRIFFLKKL